MHINNIELNVFLDTNKIYIAEIDKSRQIPAIIHIDSVSCSENNIPEELDRIVRNLRIAPDLLNIIISANDYVLTQFPHTENITGDELKSIIDFEIRQNFGEVPLDHIKCILTPLDNLITKTDYVLVSLYNNFLEEKLAKFKSLSNLEIKYHFSGDTSLNSFRFNYPEFLDKTIGIAEICDNVVLFSVISPGGLAFMQFREFDGDVECQVVIANLLNELRINAQITINSIFICGEKLTMQILENIKLSLADIEVMRFNTFRKLSANLDIREREYCSRTMHIFPSCIGASLPVLQDNIEFL